ncbi:P-loop NTPase [Azospirillum sp. sgz302134]
MSWKLIDFQSPPSWIEQPLDSNDLDAFFHGSSGASWRLAADARIKPLAVVGKVLGSLGERDPGSRPRIVMLGGGCGEGKTTALRQTVLRWLQQAEAGARRALVREGSVGPADDVIANLPISENDARRRRDRWLVVVDNAKPILEIFDLAEALFRHERYDVDILIACSHIAWPHDQAWPPQAPRNARFELIVRNFIGLSWEDTGSIIDGWVAFNVVPAAGWNQKWSQFYDHARHEASPFTDPEGVRVEGSLLGALLVEWGGSGGAAQRLNRIVKQLSDDHRRPDGKAPLLYALCATSVAHAEGFPGFTRGFLLHCLRSSGQCRDDKEAGELIKRLLYEAVVVETTEGTLATRHHAVAQRLARECARELGIADEDSLLADLINFAQPTTSHPSNAHHHGSWRQLLTVMARHALRRGAVREAALFCMMCLSDTPGAHHRHGDALKRDVARSALNELANAARRAGCVAEPFQRHLQAWIDALDWGMPPPGQRPEGRAFDRVIADVAASIIDAGWRFEAAPGAWQAVAGRPQDHRFSHLFALIFHRTAP